MKKFNLFSLFFVGTIVFGFVASVQAQEEMPPDARRGASRRGDSRPNLLRELGLTREQMQQIRQINENRRASMQQAQQRLRDSMRELDQAIYADAVSESDIQTRLKALQDAQAEISRLRAASELEVRKILTAEQLVKFRELRRRFAEIRKNKDAMRPDSSPGGNKNRPERRFNRQLRKVPKI